MAVSQMIKKSADNTSTASAFQQAVVQIVYFLCGVMVSKGAVLGGLSPFGASLTAAAPKKYLFACTAGTVLGYIMLSPTDSFRYIASMAAIGALRWILSDVKRISSSRLFAPAIAFVPVFATGVVLLYSGTSELSRFSLCIIEAIAAGGGAFFIKSTFELFSSGRSLSSLSLQELASAAMAGCILILSLGTINVEQVSLGRIAAVLIILLCGRYGSVSAGSISGIATGVMFSLSSVNMSFLCAGYSFGGMMSGLFAPLGKIASAAAFALCNLIMSFSCTDSKIIIALLIETVTAAVIFMLIPKSVGNTLSSIFLPNNKEENSKALKNSVVMRLDFASKALKNVSSCVTGVSQKLKKMYSPTMEKVYEKSIKEVCSGCGLRVYCLEKQKGITNDDFNRLSKALSEKGSVSAEDINEQFVKRCCKHKELAHSINKNYAEYLAYEQAQSRVAQVRSVVAGQFSGLSEILKDLSLEFESYEQYDVDSANRVSEAVRKLGLVPIDCSCRVDSSNRMTLELEAIVSGSSGIKKSLLVKEVSKSCGRRFDSPCISYAGDRVRIAFNEMPLYDVEVGTSQHISENGNLCGDCINYFNNGFGSMVALISDGMGTGGRAAVDGNMTSSIMTKLCKAGLSYDCAVQVVNSSLMIKSEEESLATLDMADINLFTGKVKLMKAGAPVTFIKKNSKIIKKNMPSLPLGILNEVRFAKDSVNLTQDDMIVMVSDGAMYGDEKWIEALILSWNEGRAEELASEIVSRAQKRRNDGHDDDITAVVLKIVSNY